MSLWTNVDESAGAPVYKPVAGVDKTGTELYGNTTPDAFVTGIELGVFGVAPNETVGTGNVSSIAITAAGGDAYGLPAITITGANTTQATAKVNVKITSVTIETQGTGYEVGNTFQVHTGSNTTTGVLTVNDVDENGNITVISVTTPGDYFTIASANDNPLAVNTASGTGFTANIRFGILSATVTAAGEGYNQATVGATFSANGISDAIASVTLTGQEGTNNGGHTGWNIRTEGSGGRAGRVQYETIVAMGSMTGDGEDDTQLAD
jgi:hypothetical protein